MSIRKSRVTGQFGGRNLLGDLPDAPGKSRYDFVLRSADAAIWVERRAAAKARVRPLARRAHRHRPLARDHRHVQHGPRARVARRRAATASSSARRRPKRRRPRPSRSACPAAPPPEVVFSAPTQDETDVSMGTSVRIQFSRDIDQRDAQGARRRARTSIRRPPNAASRRRRRPSSRRSTPAPTRVLELKFTKPLERFRTVRIELSSEILGTDKQPLKPWTLNFDLGGA